MSLHFAPVCLVAVLALAVSGTALGEGGRAAADGQAADHADNRPHGGNGSAAGNSLPDSVRRAERETGGQVLKAQPIQREGREVYRVKVLTPEGRIKVVEDDRGAPAREPVSEAPKPENGHH